MTTLDIDSGSIAAGKQVSRLYQLVDAGDPVGVANMFAPDAVYHRPGYEPMVGREQVLEFYRHGRVIKDGQHIVEAVVTDGRQVAVHGEFHGRLRDDSQLDLRFADFIVLDAAQQISTRRSFFYVAMA